jgi:hypothetical protein
MSYSGGGQEVCYFLAVDRAIIINMLQAAEDHVASGATQIAKQRDLISRLGGAGEDATGAVALLHELQRTQERHVEDRDRLRAELAVLNAAEAAKAATSKPGLQRRNRRRSRRTPYGIR